MERDKIYDVVVVGGGAAGLSAAVTLGRALRSVLVVDAGEPRNGRSTAVHAFLSREGLPPGELLAAGRAEVRAHGGEILHGRAVSARKENGIFITGPVASLEIVGDALKGVRWHPAGRSSATTSS
jgi:thioredoxin reductase